jgi:hypothetical protein
VNKSGIPWSILFSAEIMTEYVGTSLGAYHTDAETHLRTQQVYRERFQEMYGVSPAGGTSSPFSPSEGYGVSPSSYTGITALGATTVFPEDHMPMVSVHPIQEPSQVYQVELPASYIDSPAMAPWVAMHGAIQERLGPDVKVRLGGGWQGPVTSAVLLRGQDFLLDLYEYPNEAHALLRLVSESIIQCETETRAYSGVDVAGGMSIHDDFAALISPAMFPEFVIPYWKQVYEAFGVGPRPWHSELLRREHLPLLAELCLTHLNFGEDQYLTVTDVVETTDVPFEWNVRTVKHMLQGTPGTIRRAYEEAIADGAPKMTTDLCARGIPPDNIRAYIEVAREHE